MRIAIGADHAGFRLKDSLAAYLRDLGHEVFDTGTNSGDPVAEFTDEERYRERLEKVKALEARYAGQGRY